MFEADQAAAESQEGLVDVGTSFIADNEALHLVEPGEGTRHNPSDAAPVLEEHLGDRQQFYNFQWSHRALGGRRPVQRCCECYPQKLWSWDVVAQYDASSEPIRARQYMRIADIVSLWRNAVLRHAGADEQSTSATQTA